MRYHQTTDSHGNVVMRQCNATVRGCPLGGDSVHHDFHSRETAGYWNESQRLMDDGVYMGAVQDITASGEAFSQDDYERHIKQAMAYRKDYDARGDNAFLDERNLDFLIANAPLDKLHELMESSDYMTYDKLMAVHSRLEKQPDGPGKNQVQKDLIDQATMANNTFERYQNGEDYVFHMQKEYGTQFVSNAGYADIGEAQRDFDSTRDNIRKMIQEIARNPSPDVEEALKVYMDDRRSENAQMHVYHEDRKRNTLNTPPAPSEGRRAPVPPSQSNRNGNVPPVPPAPRARTHRGTPPVPPAPSSRPRSKNTPPAPPQEVPLPLRNDTGRESVERIRRRNSPDWSRGVHEARIVIGEYDKAVSELQSRVMESRSIVEDYDNNVKAFDDMIDHSNRAFMRYQSIMDAQRSMVFGPSYSDSSARGNLSKARHLIGSFISNPRNTMQGLRAIRNSRKAMETVDGTLRMDKANRDGYIRDNYPLYAQATHDLSNGTAMLRRLGMYREQLANTYADMIQGNPARIYDAAGPDRFSENTTVDTYMIRRSVSNLRNRLHALLSS